MMLEIVYWPDPILKQRCEEVPEVTDAVRWLLSEMEETMLDAKGVGLAAPQVGRSLRAITLLRPTGLPLSLVNPVVLERSKEKVRVREGCLSLPGYFENVERHDWVQVEGRNKDDKLIRFRADGLLGQACQHEIEHLDGIVFVDHLSTLKRGIARKKVEKELLRRFASEYEEDGDEDDRT
jgi:peptide deformylase